MDRNQAAVALFDRLAHQYEAKYMDVSAYHDSLDTFLKGLPADASLLELACGPGNITKYVLQQRPDLRITGIDLSPAMIERAIHNNPSADFRVMDVRTIASLPSMYDAVICGFCLPYLSEDEVARLMRDVAALLKPGGLLYLSTMIQNEQYSSGIQRSSSGDELYMYFHASGFITDTLHLAGLGSRLQHTQDFPVDGMAGMTDLVIIAGK